MAFVGAKNTAERRGFVDWLIKKLRPHWIRERTALYLRKFERFGPLDWLDLPEGCALCVIAPHPDDESIGCGGLLAKWTQAGRHADVVFLTRGEQGDRRLRQESLDPAQADKIRIETIATRRDEAKQALSILNAQDHWLDGTDGQLYQDELQLGERLRALWHKTVPDVICTPFPGDRHADHAVAARIVAHACKDLPIKPVILAYEVWSPAPIDSVLDITDVAGLKWDAIAAHRSQVATTNYLKATQALNTYRAITAGRHGFAEGYCRLDFDQFEAMTKTLEI